MLSKFLTLAQVVQQIIWQTFKEITDKARIVFQNDVHFVINCFLYCRLFVLIVQFHIIFYLFTFVIAEQKDLLMESSKTSQHLPKRCVEQALAGGLGGGIVPPLAAHAGDLVAVQQAGGLQGDEGDSNGGEEDVEEDEPDNDDDEHDQAGEVYVHLHFSYSIMFS